jgi:osmotically-inducible protein OsmY
MRRFLFGLVIASIAAASPTWALGDDREIAKTVMSELQQYKDAGQLKGFDINLKVEDGVVYLLGDVANRNQRALIAKAAANAAGLENVVNEIRVREARVTQQVQAASATEAMDAPNSRDTQITDSIYDQLAQAKAAGILRGFDLDISTVNGDVWVRGSVANDQQKSFVLDVARRINGVARVVDDLTVTGSSGIRQVSTEVAAQPVPAPIPSARGASMPVAGQPQTGPRPFAPSGLASCANGQCIADGGVMVGGGPAPIGYADAGSGVGAPRYDQPNLPNYAWPSYAAYPNYGAVTYPKQYSPSAWPYIGPFYPYPQVPLGWRRVSLEWDDGLWYLDFSSKSGRR